MRVLRLAGLDFRDSLKTKVSISIHPKLKSQSIITSPRKRKLRWIKRLFKSCFTRSKRKLSHTCTQRPGNGSNSWVRWNRWKMCISFTKSSVTRNLKLICWILSRDGCRESVVAAITLLMITNWRSIFLLRRSCSNNRSKTSAVGIRLSYQQQLRIHSMSSVIWRKLSRKYHRQLRCTRRMSFYRWL